MKDADGVVVTQFAPEGPNAPMVPLTADGATASDAPVVLVTVVGLTISNSPPS